MYFYAFYGNMFFLFFFLFRAQEGGDLIALHASKTQDYTLVLSCVG